MHLFIRRLLKLFTTYTIVYQGKGVSNNEFYAGASGPQGWKIRAGIKAKYAKIFKILLLQKNPPKFKEYALLIFFNSKHDCDNVVGSGKIFADVLKEKWVDNDDKRYCKATFQIYDPTLAHNTFEFVIIKLK